MKIMKFLFLLLLFIFNEASGQSRYLKRSIDYSFRNDASQEISVHDLTRFRFALYDEHGTTLPLYSDVIEWVAENENISVKFFSADYEELPDKYAADDIFAGLTGEISVDAVISFERRKPFLILSFTPFRKNNMSGKIERIKNFVLEIESVPVKPTPSLVKKSFSPENSKLSSGEWFKIRVPANGIYKLTYDQLKTIGLSDPSTVRLFGSGGQVLPEDIREGKKDDLMPVQIFMNKGSDNIFNQGDYILFYALGTDKWTYDAGTEMFRCKKNPYSDFSYYFLTSINGSVDLPLNYDVPEGELTFNIQTYDFYYHHELHLRNLIKSGKKWYGEEFDLLTQHSFDIQVQGLITTEPVLLLTNLLSRAKDSATFILGANGSDIETFRVRHTNLNDYIGTFAQNTQKKTYFNSSSGNISLNLRYLKPDASAKGWLDFITLNAKATLNLNADQLLIRDISSVLPGALTRFHISNADNNVVVWDVSDINNILDIPYNVQSGSLSFSLETSSLREIAVFRKNGAFPSPEFSGSGLGKIENQNLHGTDVPEMLIITYDDFIDQANMLASYRSEKNNMDILITTPQEIYNEFSSGTPDITALRNFMVMLYQKDGFDGKLKNLLLFGDGSYDNKGVSDNPGNFIPTYQSDNSLSPILSYLTDDYFALLDPGEHMITGLLDIGVGRLPVSTSVQAEAMVNKIIEYEDPVNMGTWRNTVCFIGDDEDNNIHMQQANQLATYVNSKYPSFNINKIYLDAYKQLTTPVGQRYPDVNRAINDQMTRGALIINYTGHGGTDGLGHEKILTLSDISSWKNHGKYPLILTATCDFSRFDDFERITAGEEAMLNPSGGGIALLTTTRLVYSGPNHALNERFYEIVFEKNDEKENYCLGSIMKYTKNKSGAGINKRNFTLLGDPSMQLSYPGLRIITDSINGKHISEQPDTLKAFSFATISGHIEDYQGNIMNNMDGTVFPRVYDKPLQISTLANDGGNVMTFSIQNSILYSGKASLKDGYFNFNFIIPKDINYGLGKGKISYYGHDQETDATGFFNEAYIGGTSENYVTDTEGPQVDVYLNNQNFKSGDITDPDPVLYVKVHDESGINTTGNGVGHDITAVLNESTSGIYLLNEYFQSGIDSYKGGTIEYPLFNLEEGSHRISVKVWDIYNNSGEGSVEFMVVNSKEMFMNEIFNYPNPFKENTWFSFGHNEAGSDLDITIDIFNSGGELVKTIKAKEYSSGFRSTPIIWDGKNEAGNQNRQGLYIYRIRVISSQGNKAEKSGKLLIVN